MTSRNCNYYTYYRAVFQGLVRSIRIRAGSLFISRAFHPSRYINWSVKEKEKKLNFIRSTTDPILFFFFGQSRIFARMSSEKLSWSWLLKLWQTSMCLGVSSVCRRFHYSEASFGVHPIHLSAKFTFIRGEGVSITVHDVKISFNASTANLFPFPWPLENSWPRFEGDGLESRRFDRKLRREKCASHRRFILVCLLRERKRSSTCVFDENWIERRDRCFVVSFVSSFISLVQKDVSMERLSFEEKSIDRWSYFLEKKNSNLWDLSEEKHTLN